jgi:hypothetical protein
MFVASKYEEMYAPEIQDFVYITDNAYTKRDILRMEIKVGGDGAPTHLLLFHLYRC